LLALALFQACGGESGRSTGPTATTSVDIPVVFRRAAQIPAGCTGVLTAVGPGPTQTVALPPLEVMLSLTAGVWTLTVTITCGSETATGQATVTVVPPTPIQVNIQVTTAGTLTVNRNGDGTVTGPGINCGGDCSERYTIGTVVTLNATPAAGSAFTGWSGGGCGGTGACRLTITTAPITVTANFAGPLGLTVAIAGTGSGTVTSSPGGIACPPTCNAQFAPGTEVRLTAAPAGGSTFTGWSGGGCSGTGPCTVTVTDRVTVTATFTGTAAAPATLTVVKSGTAAGGGTVTSSPPGIACGGACSAQFPTGQPVTLTATAAAGSTFTGWSGGGCPASPTQCPLTLTANTIVTANFELNGTIEIFNQVEFDNLNIPVFSGPFGTSFGPLLVPSSEVGTISNAPPGNYTIPGGQHYNSEFSGPCPPFNFSVTPGGTTTVTYNQIEDSPQNQCSVALGGPAQRRRR
jgi:hypothetical protein